MTDFPTDWVRTMSDEESDLYEHEMYVIEVFDEWQRDRMKKNDVDYFPDFFRGFRSDENIKRMYEISEDENLDDYIISNLAYIYKTPILSKCEVFKNKIQTEEECEKIEKLGIKTRIRKVDVRLKDE